MQLQTCITRYSIVLKKSLAVRILSISQHDRSPLSSVLLLRMGIVHEVAVLVLDADAAIGVARLLATVVEQSLDGAIRILPPLRTEKAFRKPLLQSDLASSPCILLCAPPSPRWPGAVSCPRPRRPELGCRPRRSSPRSRQWRCASGNRRERRSGGCRPDSEPPPGHCRFINQKQCLVGQWKFG